MNHKDLKVWNDSIEFVKKIYKATQDFPQNEIYGLVNQMRRSAVSIPSNISEGAARSSTKEYIHFLYIALGSASELETQLIISEQLNYLTDKEIIESLGEIKKMLVSLIKSLRSHL